MALLLYAPIGLGAVFAYWKALQALRRQPSTGEESMIGDRATVASIVEGKCEVHYRGELWRAESAASLRPGEPVIIQDVEGLTLRVMPAPRYSKNGQSA